VGVAAVAEDNHVRALFHQFRYRLGAEPVVLGKLVAHQPPNNTLEKAQRIVYTFDKVFRPTTMRNGGGRTSAKEAVNVKDGATTYIARVNAVEAQRLTVRILTVLPPAASLRLSDKLKAGALLRESVRQLGLCAALGSELRKDPQRYDSLEKLCASALKRQTQRKDIRKKEYADAMGINEKRLQRLEKGDAKLTLAHIRSLCAKFEDTVERRFWENLFLEKHPDVADLGRGDGPEAGALALLPRLLTPRQYGAALAQLDPWEQSRLEELTCPPLNLSGLDGNPAGLYPLLNALAHERGMTCAALSDEAGVSANTWFAWKKHWERAEKEDFQNGVPKTRLKRAHLLLLAVLLGLSYPQSVYLLALAGYRFVQGEPDDSVVRYLDAPSPPACLRLRGYIKEGLYTGKW